jgi:hypothetical protein
LGGRRDQNIPHYPAYPAESAGYITLGILLVKQFSPQISVEITLASEELGGRKTPILQGEYRGVFTVGEKSFSVRFCIPSERALSPSAVQNFDVQFLVPEAATPHFPVGAAFKVWEGKDIGIGRVLRVFNNA